MAQRADFFGDFVVGAYLRTLYDADGVQNANSPYFSWISDDWTGYPVKERIFNGLKRDGLLQPYIDQYAGFSGARFQNGTDYYSTVIASYDDSNGLLEWAGLIASFIPFVGQGIAAAAAAAEAASSASAVATSVGVEAQLAGTVSIAEEVAALGGGIAPSGAVIATPLVETVTLASILGAIPTPLSVAEEVAALGGGIAVDGAVIAAPLVASTASILGSIPAPVGLAEEVAALGGGIAADGSVIAAPLVASSVVSGASSLAAKAATAAGSALASAARALLSAPTAPAIVAPGTIAPASSGLLPLLLLGGAAVLIARS